MTVRELIALLSEQDEDAIATVACESSGNDAPHQAVGVSTVRLADGRVAVSIYQSGDFLDVDFFYEDED